MRERVIMNVPHNVGPTGCRPQKDSRAKVGGERESKREFIRSDILEQGFQWRLASVCVWSS